MMQIHPLQRLPFLAPHGGWPFGGAASAALRLGAKDRMWGVAVGWVGSVGRTCAGADMYW